MSNTIQQRIVKFSYNVKLIISKLKKRSDREKPRVLPFGWTFLSKRSRLAEDDYRFAVNSLVCQRITARCCKDRCSPRNTFVYFMVFFRFAQFMANRATFQRARVWYLCLRKRCYEFLRRSSWNNRYFLWKYSGHWSERRENASNGARNRIIKTVATSPFLRCSIITSTVILTGTSSSFQVLISNFRQ